MVTVSNTRTPAQIAHDLLTAGDDGRVCRDIPDAACDAQPRSFLTHVLSLGATKTGDGIADPKLTLAWLCQALGAPPWIVSLLVPVREAGALLPQLVTAGPLRSLPKRKFAWAVGSAVQGLAVAGIAAVALTAEGTEAGLMIVGLVAVFALARSVCSVSYKDVLGKTVSKGTRGSATGAAAAAASVLVLAFGAGLAFGLIPLTPPAIAAALLVAAGLWIGAGLLFTTLPERAGATEGGGNPLTTAIAHLGMLKRDAALRRFILVRGLLISTALAPPYLLAIDARAGSGASLGSLGPFVIVSALASIISNPVWGRLADRSSRSVLIAAGAIAAPALAAAAAVGYLEPEADTLRWLLPTLLFALMIAYQGVRLGRSTYLVDMADEDTRLAYTALSNTIIGLVLLAAGAFAAVAHLGGVPLVLLSFAVMSAAASLLALGLRRVSA